MHELTAWSPAILALTGALIVSSVPLAVYERRLRRRKLAREQDRGHIERVMDAPLPPPTRKRDKFIAKSVSVTRFGDKRRRTAAVTEIITPETGPIDVIGPV